VGLTAKLLIAGSCLVIVCVLIGIASRTTSTPERLSSEALQQLVDPDDMGPHPSPWLWQERLVRATDFALLAESALPAAQAGNADAQFALYGVFSYCHDGLREVHAHCEALAAQYSDLGAEAEIWLTKALDSKFPRALAFTSLRDIRAMARKLPPRSERARRTRVARENLLLALQSNDPSITEVVPEFLPALFPGAPQLDRARWIWRLAACEQGLDCGPRAPMVLDDCRTHDRCIDGEAAPEYIRRVSGDIPSLTARARNLARALRKAQLDDETFDATVMDLAAPNPDIMATSTRILEK
jgi:DNA-binding phage protein